MPVSTFFGLQTSLRGLIAHQRSLDVTGHNVANASTPGYSRQEAVLSASQPYAIAAGVRADGAGAHLGSGVEVVDFRRIRDGFLDVQFRAQSAVLGDADARARSLEGADLALAEPGPNGISHQLGKMWSAFANVANDPTSIPARQALVEQAKTVASAFAELDGQLDVLSRQARAEFDSLVAYDPGAGVFGDVAQIATEIASLGTAIKDAVLTRQTPNDLMDHRDALLDKLAQFGTVTTVDQGDGGLVVHFGGLGDALVDDRRVGDKVVFDPSELVAPGGRLGALKSLSDPLVDGGTFATYRSELTRVAQDLASNVNAIHRTGAGGLDFFSIDPALGAAGLAVAVRPQDVDTGSTGAPGANDVALGISRLRGGAADEQYAALVARIGSEVRQNTRVQSNAQVLVDAVEDRRQSAAGVSLDEEMTNLIRFQRGFQASARTMSTLDEMLEQLINRTGRVGL